MRAWLAWPPRLRTSTQAALAWAESQSLRLSGNRVQVQLVTDATGLQGAIAAMTNVGGEMTGVGNDGTLLQGWLPVGALRDRRR